MKTITLLPFDSGADKYGPYLVVRARFSGYDGYKHARFVFLYDSFNWRQVITELLQAYGAEDLQVQRNFAVSPTMMHRLLVTVTSVLLTDNDE